MKPPSSPNSGDSTSAFERQRHALGTRAALRAPRPAGARLDDLVAPGGADEAADQRVRRARRDAVVPRQQVPEDRAEQGGGHHASG